MLVEPANPIGFNEEDFGVLRESLADEGVDARLALRPERGYGGPLSEVFHVFIEQGDDLKHIADLTRDVILDLAAIAKVVTWAQRRWRSDRENHPDNPRPRVVSVYRVEPEANPASVEAAHVATVRIDLPDGEPVIESNGTPPRQPPKAQPSA